MRQLHTLLFVLLGVAGTTICTNDALAQNQVTYLGNFTGKTGGHPLSEPIVGADGNYYGVTPVLAKNDAGSIYRMTSAGDLSTLHLFRGKDGSEPSGRLIQATDGAFYGTTYSGGRKKGCGAVFRITPDGTFTTIHIFDCDNGGSNPSGGLIQARDGFLYGMTESGGKKNDGVVYKIDLSGSFSVVANFGAYIGSGLVNSGSRPHAELVQANDGTFYGFTTKNGGHRSGAFFSMDANGTLTHIFGFDPGDFPNGGLTYLPKTDEVVGTQATTRLFSYSQGHFGTFAAVYYGNSIIGGLTLGPDGTTLYGYCTATSGGCVYSVDPTGKSRHIVGHLKGTPAGKPTFTGSGTLVGVTMSGGYADDGVAFDLNPTDF
jgi:uncharacterized repeat protein (TIGR03803 family)